MCCIFISPPEGVGEKIRKKRWEDSTVATLIDVPNGKIIWTIRGTVQFHIQTSSFLNLHIRRDKHSFYNTIIMLLSILFYNKMKGWGKRGIVVYLKGFQ